MLYRNSSPGSTVETEASLTTRIGLPITGTRVDVGITVGEGGTGTGVKVGVGDMGVVVGGTTAVFDGRGSVFVGGGVGDAGSSGGADDGCRVMVGAGGNAGAAIRTGGPRRAGPVE